MSRDTEYGDQIADDAWVAEEPEKPDRTSVASHEIEVIYTVDPDADMGYGREKYSANIQYDDTGEPYVLFVVEHKWKSNYWRDTTDWDYRDIPEPVRQRIATELPVASPKELEPDVRTMDEDGESRFQKYHKSAIQNTRADQMWGLSNLKEGLERIDHAAESFNEGSKGEEVSEKVANSLRKVIRVVENND